jgi:chemotaxis protein MotB
MSQKRRRASAPNHERWLVSYADFITLLFAFFVVMFASSQVDKGKIGKLAIAIEAAFKDLGIFNLPSSKVPPTRVGPTQEDLATVPELPEQSTMSNLPKLQKELAQQLASEIKRGAVAIKVGREGLVVSLREVGFFDSGSADVKLKSEPSVARIAKILEHGRYQVRIEGHTDNVPIHTPRFASNWELSTSRATEMAKLFITRYDFPPERLSAAGYAEFHPVASNETAEGRALNRRVDIVVVASPSKSPSRPGSSVAAGAMRPPAFVH